MTYYLKCAAIKEKIQGLVADTAVTYTAIGNAYYRLGQYDKALEYYIHAAIIYEIFGDNNKSLEYHLKALAIREAKLGEHQDTAGSCNLIGIVYHILYRNEAVLQRVCGVSFQPVLTYAGALPMSRCGHKRHPNPSCLQQSGLPTTRMYLNPRHRIHSCYRIQRSIHLW